MIPRLLHETKATDVNELQTEKVGIEVFLRLIVNSLIIFLFYCFCALSTYTSTFLIYCVGTLSVRSVDQQQRSEAANGVVL